MNAPNLISKPTRTAFLFALAVALVFFVSSCGGGGGATAATTQPVSATSQAAPAASSDTDPFVADATATDAGADAAQSDPAAAATADPAAAFMLAVLPDTQHTTVDYPDIYNAQLQWIADHKDSDNIAFVLHEGDMSHYGNATGWENGSAGLELLDGVVPYALAVGNHDMDDLATRDTATFNAYFPVSRYENTPAFGGSYPEGTMNNAYFTFSAGGTDWLVLSIIYLPTQADLDWAAGVLGANPHRRAIVVTHALINQDNEIGRDAQTLWNNFLSKHAAIALVFNGHYTDGESGRLALAGDSGNTVYGLFANYQKSAYGGAGYMRLVTVDPAAGTVAVQTYSPWAGAYKTDDGNAFTLTGVDLSTP